MRNLLRRDIGPLVLLLASLAMTPWGCATGASTPDQASSEMEPSQNEELAAGDKELTESPDVGNEDSKDLDSASTDESSELAEDDAAAAAPILPPTPAEAYVAGKGGVAMDSGLPEAGSKMAYIVQKGDTLSKLAKRIFGDQERWHDLAEASALSNPNRIYPGDVIYYQLDKVTVAFAKDYENLERKEVSVNEGETLSEVSQRVYGDPSAWKMLWRHNDKISDPNHLQLGSIVYYVPMNAVKMISGVQKHSAKTFGKIVSVKMKVAKSVKRKAA